MGNENNDSHSVCNFAKFGHVGVHIYSYVPYVHCCEDIIAEGLSVGKKGVTDMYYGIWSFGVTFLYIKQFMTSIFIKI